MMTLYGGGRVMVKTAAVPAFRALDELLRKHNYKTRAHDTGGYNCRRTTNETGYSLHAYGIAIDINWQSNPYGPRLITNMPAAMIADITNLRTNSGDKVFRWGGSYKGNKDAMHFEVICTPQQLRTGIAGRPPQNMSLPPSAAPNTTPQLPQIGPKQMFAIIRYPDGRCFRWNGIHRVSIPNEEMLGGDRLMLGLLGMNSTIFAVNEAWGDSFPLAFPEDRLLWNSRVLMSEAGIPEGKRA